MKRFNRINRLTVIGIVLLILAGCRLGSGSVLTRATAVLPTDTPENTRRLTATLTPTFAPTFTPSPSPSPTITSTSAPVIPLANQLVDIPAPSLAGNLLDDPTVQPLRVLLPPSYDKGELRYPVVYMLPGFGGSAVTDEYFPAQQIAEMIAKSDIKEMILVVVNGENRLGGSFYVNSPVTGNWEDFVTKDVIRYIDEHYRTIPLPAGRGISGHSMGGYGAFYLAMRHPDLYGSVYAMSSGLFDKNGLADSYIFFPTNRINAFLKSLAELDGLTKEQAIRKMAKADGAMGFTYAYGAAFAPQPELGPPFFTYPIQKKNDEFVRNEEAWKAWEAGFGGLAEKIQSYQDNLRKLNGIVIDYGRQDAYEWIPRGSDYLSQLLNQAGIEHRLLSYDGDHSNQLKKRVLDYVLPFFSERLADPEIINN